MLNEETSSNWIRTVAALVATLLGLSILAANVIEVARADGVISQLRAHGRRVPGDASVEWACSRGRGGGCSPSAVWLAFKDAEGLRQFAEEHSLAHSLYAPSAPPDVFGHIRTTIVYTPGDPDGAQAAGVLKWNSWDLIERRWAAFAVGLALAVGGLAPLVRRRQRPR